MSVIILALRITSLEKLKHYAEKYCIDKKNNNSVYSLVVKAPREIKDRRRTNSSKEIAYKRPFE